MSEPPLQPDPPPTDPSAPEGAAPDPVRGPQPLRRKAPPSSERAALRKNKIDRTRDRDWTRRYLQGAEEDVEEAEVEAMSGKGDLSRKRVYVPPGQRTAGAADMLRGYVTRLRGLWAHVWDGAGELPCSVRGVLKSFATKGRNVIAVGDRVVFRRLSATEGVIEAVEPRTTTLARSDSRHADREHVVVANVDQLVIVGSMRQPDLRLRLVDRYLVSAQKGGLTPLIVLNKADLDEGPPLRRALELYTGLGYRIVAASAHSGRGIDELRGLLTGKTSVIAGQSGVGKSSLLNAVQPGLNLRVGEISAETDKGRHTTTEVTLLPLTGGGAVVDTPGIRSFGLWNLHPAELEACFVEFADKVACCKFADCTHRHETGCAIITAVESGSIAEERYESYLNLYESLESGRPDPRD